jgi:hypothetical protein
MKIELILALLLLPIASAVSDTTPPTLVSFDFEPKVVDVSKSDQNVTFTIRLKDDLSGVDNKSITFTLRSPSKKYYEGTQLYWDQYLFSGNMLDSTYLSNITLPRYTESGKWTVSYIGWGDKVGNDVHLREPEEIEKLGFPTVIEVKS